MSCRDMITGDIAAEGSKHRMFQGGNWVRGSTAIVSLDSYSANMATSYDETPQREKANLFFL